MFARPIQSKLLGFNHFLQCGSQGGRGCIIGCSLDLLDLIGRVPTHQGAGGGQYDLWRIVGQSLDQRDSGGGAVRGVFCQARPQCLTCPAAHHSETIMKYLRRLESRHGKGRSKSILAHKIGRAVYIMLRRGTVFDEAIFLRN